MRTKKYVDKTLEGTESVPKGMVKVVEHQRDQFKAERNSLIDDLSWYKAKVSRLERKNEKLKVESDVFFEDWKFKSGMYTILSEESDKYKTLLSEISQHIGNKPSSSTYKYFRAKLDGIGIKEGDSDV